MQLIEWGIQVILDIISGIGYGGILLLMALESACIPVPSEIVMPFSGMLAESGRFDLLSVALVGTAGCVIGSVVSYWVGLKGGRDFILKYGSYIHIKEKNLDSAERWFAKYGTAAIFITRLLPIVRTFISFPAGMAKCKFWPFVAMTAVGSFIWCYALAYIGFVMGDSWRDIEGIYRWLDVAVVIGFAAVVIWFLYERKRSKSNS